MIETTHYIKVHSAIKNQVLKMLDVYACGTPFIMDDGTIKVITCDDDPEMEVRNIAINIARICNRYPFKIRGVIDTSDLAGEMMDFYIELKDGLLNEQFSDWYVETDMAGFDGYEDFCDSFFDCTEEEYEKIKDQEFVYIIETEDGEILASEVPLGKKEPLAY
jgi:hypothetical protein